MRWDEIGARSRALLERVARRAFKPGTPLPALEARVEAQAGPTPPRVAVAEEALEGILGRILDEAAKHSRWSTGSSIALAWSLGRGPDGGDAAVVDVEMRGCSGFDEAGMAWRAFSPTRTAAPWAGAPGSRSRPRPAGPRGRGPCTSPAPASCARTAPKGGPRG
jgi:hypothetical protein